MKTHIAEHPPSTIEPDIMREVLEKILGSKHFVNAHKKKQFLRLICNFYLEGRAHELNEHILGYDVFGRKNGYNPSDDPIVRVCAHEIRKKLEVYYGSEGADDPIRLGIPAGSYQPVFTPRASEPTALETPVPPPEIVAEPRRRHVPLKKLAISFAGLGLVIAVVVLAL